MFKGISVSGLAIVAVLVGAGFASAQPVGGDSEGTYRVQAYETNSYTIELYGGDVTQINLIGDGDTDLDLFVYDSWGNLVAKNDDVRDFCRVRFTPNQRATYRIEVKNLGSVYNDFVLRVH